MPTTTNHNVNIDDTMDNWLKWGNLVMSWVKGVAAPPTTVGTKNSTDLTTLYGQMNKAGVTGTVHGSPGRGVTCPIYSTDPNDAVTIPLPNSDMVKLDEKTLRDATHNGANPAPYPLQSFYAACFAGAPQAQFSLQQLLDMEARRIGEYVINECM